MKVYVVNEVIDLGGPYSTADACCYFLRKESAENELRALQSENKPSHIIGYEIDEVEVIE
jgi:hypothetical protein